MNITVSQITKTYKLDGEDWYCAHSDVSVEPPCCTEKGSSGYIDCGCGGMYTIYCNDCNNKDLFEYQIDEILERYVYGSL